MRRLRAGSRAAAARDALLTFPGTTAVYKPVSSKVDFPKQENEILHKQRATDELLHGPGAQLPALPPK